MALDDHLVEERRVGHQPGPAVDPQRVAAPGDEEVQPDVGVGQDVAVAVGPPVARPLGERDRPCRRRRARGCPPGRPSGWRRRCRRRPRSPSRRTASRPATAGRRRAAPDGPCRAPARPARRAGPRAPRPCRSRASRCRSAAARSSSRAHRPMPPAWIVAASCTRSSASNRCNLRRTIARSAARVRGRAGRRRRTRATTKALFRASSTRRRSKRRGKIGRPAPRVTGAMQAIISSSRPASANCAARSPPPTTQTSLVARGRDHLGVHTAATSPETNRTSAPSMPGRSRWVKTQDGWA